MTDNVNVPREAGEVLYNAFWSRNGGVFVAWKDQADAIVSMWRNIASDAAILASAPKAEPDVCPRPLYDWMVERGIWPDDGPAEWPDVIQALNDHENEITQPEAPKVEQELAGKCWVLQRNDFPYAVYASKDEADAVCTEARRKESVWREENKHVADVRVFWNVYPANISHPAPASDELLEALGRLIDRAEEVRDLLAAHPSMQGRDHDIVGVALNNAIGRAQSAYAANHKEAQS